MKKDSFLRNHGLGIALSALTLACLGGHLVAGYLAENDERREFGRPLSSLGDYVASSAFLSSLFENWESEFVQMAVFVLLTVSLRQKGSSESKPLEEDADQEPPPPTKESPWPVRRGGLWLRMYEHSLSAALLALFAGSFLGHWLSSYHHYQEETQLAQRAPDHDLWGHLASSPFWFESFQNWQSEFLSVTALVCLSIYLREKGSPQSKPVNAPHAKTGSAD